jgi:hypothetical protein
MFKDNPFLRRVRGETYTHEVTTPLPAGDDVPLDVMFPGFVEASMPTIEDVLRAQIALQEEVLLQQAHITAAARHLIDVLAMKSAGGPVFRLNEDNSLNHELVMHAVMDLQAKLNGTELPAFCLPTETEIN